MRLFYWQYLLTISEIKTHSETAGKLLDKMYSSFFSDIIGNPPGDADSSVSGRRCYATALGARVRFANSLFYAKQCSLKIVKKPQECIIISNMKRKGGLKR